MLNLLIFFILLLYVCKCLAVYLNILRVIHMTHETCNCKLYNNILAMSFYVFGLMHGDFFPQEKVLKIAFTDSL